MKIDLIKIKETIKQIVLDSGANLVGIGSREKLKDTFPSGNMKYCLLCA